MRFKSLTGNHFPDVLQQLNLPENNDYNVVGMNYCNNQYVILLAKFVTSYTGDHQIGYVAEPLLAQDQVEATIKKQKRKK